MDGDASDPLLYRDETFRVRRAIFDVHGAMGAGFLESVDQECLSLVHKTGHRLRGAEAAATDVSGSGVAADLCRGLRLL